MRHLSPAFLANLQSGLLAAIPAAVRPDPDLNLEVRQGYLSIYYKGHSLPKLATLPFRDQVRIFTGGLAMWQQNVRPVGTVLG